MTAARAVRLVGMAACCAAAAAACGHKGDPKQPLRPIPVAVADWAIERTASDIRLRITIPDANLDGSSPPAVDRVDIYAITQAADAAAPGPTDLVVPANLKASIEIRPSTPLKPGSPPDPRPGAGEVTTFVDPDHDFMKPAAPGAAGAVRYYATVASASRRRSHTSAILPVPLGDPPPVPADVKIAYTEQKLTLSWSAGAASVRYLVDETDERGGSAKRITPAPLEALTLDQPVVFEKSLCFSVRSAEVQGAVTILGAGSVPACVTPRDHFPPPAPSDLQAVPGDGGVDLVWTAAQAADLAGYLVLRGDGANGTLRELTSAPVTSSSYRDTTVQSGTSYIYAVVAVDKATPPNKSDLSNKYQVTARAPVPLVRRER